jgi:hypothetical protein
VQERLHAELLSLPLPGAPAGNAPLDQDTLSELDKLPLLDAVVRETLRLHAPVPSTLRTAVRDDVIPLATPFVDRNGVMQDVIRYVPCERASPRHGANSGVQDCQG